MVAGSVPSISLAGEEMHIFVPDGCVTMQLNCTTDTDSAASLVWVQGEFEPKPIPDEYTIMTVNPKSVILKLNFSSICSYLYITLEGTALYCLANNSLGTVRSRSVILLKPGKGDGICY